MSFGAKAAYFDAIAGNWDGWEDLPRVATRLAAGLEELGVGEDETVLDAGCGTGNLTQVLLKKLSSAGRVIAVDISPRMIEVARRKVSDPRVAWENADIRRLPLEDATCDRAICYSVWPHVDDPGEAAREIGRVLKPGGRLHIWHLDSRQKINSVHAAVDGPISHDLLPPASKTADLLESLGFIVSAAIDASDRYLVTATRRRAGM
jgi:demethylmenaquinone methyltransferase/2-methoxy-6-polyprenyl-1,4-benzoquinol methylase